MVIHKRKYKPAGRHGQQRFPYYQGESSRGQAPFFNFLGIPPEPGVQPPPQHTHSGINGTIFYLQAGILVPSYLIFNLIKLIQTEIFYIHTQYNCRGAL